MMNKHSDSKKITQQTEQNDVQSGKKRRGLRAFVACVAALAMLVPVSGTAMAAQTPQKLVDRAVNGTSETSEQSTSTVKPSEVVRFTTESIVRNLVATNSSNQQILADSAVLKSVQNSANGSARIVPVDEGSSDGSSSATTDADGYTQWETDENDTDEGIGWKIENGTLYLRPWSGDSGTTGSVDLGSAVLATAIPWYTRRTEIKNIETTGTIYLNTYSDLLFYGCSNLTSLAGLANVNATKMAYGRAMFQDCTSLKNLHGLENWTFTANNSILYFGSNSIYDNGVEGGYSYNNKAAGMFLGCSGLTDISALANWRIPQGSSATLAGMFQDCTSLTNLHGLEDWDIYNASYLGVEIYDSTGNATYAGMFSGCTSLTDLSALSGWKFKPDDDSSGVTAAPGLFSGCTSLTTLDALQNWDVSRVYDFNGVFSGCTSLTDASATKYWDMSSNMIMNIFLGCKNLQKVGVAATDSGYSQLVSSSVAYDSTPSQSGLNEDMPTVSSEDGSLGPYTWEQLNELMQSDGSYFKQPTVWVYTPAWIADYQGNGGLGSMDSTTVALAKPVTLPNSTFMRFGYKFLGWTTQPGTYSDTNPLMKAGTTYRPDAATAGTHYKLYAQWEKIGADEEGPISGTSGMLPGWVQSEPGKHTQGTITPNDTTNVEFTNRYRPGSVAVSLTFTKLLDGNVPDTQFQFRLLDDKGNLQQTVTNTAATIAFNPLTFYSVGTYTYYINEVGAASTIDMDYHFVEAKITVTADSEDSSKLKATVQITGDTTFRNTSKPATLTLAKKVNGTTDKSKEFTFKVTLTGSDAKALGGTYSGVTFTNGVGTVKVTAGQNKVISGIPANSSYKIEETDLPSGYTLSSIDQSSGTLAANGSATVTATNTYTAAPANATLTATKYVQYGTNKPTRELVDGMFAFSLCQVADASNANSECNGVSESTNMSDGSVTFPQLTFTKAGTYVYQLREQSGDHSGMSYDTRAITATVTVTDDGAGQLQAAVAYSGGASVDGASGAVFLNKARQLGTMPKTGSAAWVAIAVAGAFTVLLLGASILRDARRRD